MLLILKVTEYCRQLNGSADRFHYFYLILRSQLMMERQSQAGFRYPMLDIRYPRLTTRLQAAGFKSGIISFHQPRHCLVVEYRQFIMIK